VSDPAVIPDLARCKGVAGVLERMHLPSKLVQQPLHWSDRKAVGNFNLILISICHQTQELSGVIDGRWCRGWDYLERKIESRCCTDPAFLEMDNLAALSCDGLNAALAPSVQRPAFSDIKERTSLINGLARHMAIHGYTSFERLCESVDYRCTGKDSVFAFLKATAAYSDPNEKKIRLLIGLLRDAHGWIFQDAHQLGAPVDYHEIRGHLRIGTVIVKDPAMKSRFQSDTLTAEDDNIVRAAISGAIDAMTLYLPGHDALHLHYVLWNFFRAGCRRDRPICRDGCVISRSELDEAYVDVFETSPNRCLFSPFCKSFESRTFPIEYSYRGNYY
jgi:hypothetical protein